MSVKNAGSVIREARIKAGLTQEQLSDGICSLHSLSRIENNTAGVCPSTFQALMAHAGIECEAYPAFASRTDFDCFYTLKRARFYLDSWQLQKTYEELGKIEDMNWANNRFYYQQWLLLYGKMQFRSGHTDHKYLYEMFFDALHISRPDFDTMNFRHLLLSISEIELCIALAQEAFYVNDLQQCLMICTQISTYLSDSPSLSTDKNPLQAEHAIVYTKYLLATGDYVNALKTADTYRKLMIYDGIDSCLHELTFLLALSSYYLNDIPHFWSYFKSAFFSAFSIESCYATICKNYVEKKSVDSFTREIFSFSRYPSALFFSKKVMDTSSMQDGTYDFSSKDALTLGSLIRELRIEQKLSQTLLCQGLCSKSTLSKIENGTLQPEIILAQSLLQRLGISDLVFNFYGNDKESALQTIWYNLKKTRIYETDQICQFVSQIRAVCTEKDTLYLQYALLEESNTITDCSQKIDCLEQALSMTLPEFDFKHILDYRLSWIELTILNNLCSAYAAYDAPVGIQYFYKIWEYSQSTPMDVLESKRFLPVTMGMLIRCLFTHKRYLEITSFSRYFLNPAIKSSLYFTGHIYFHYCQALGECDNFSDSEKYGTYSYYNYLIQNEHAGADRLKYWLAKDFGIHLL